MPWDGACGRFAHLSNCVCCAAGAFGRDTAEKRTKILPCRRVLNRLLISVGPKLLGMIDHLQPDFAGLIVKGFLFSAPDFCGIRRRRWLRGRQQGNSSLSWRGRALLQPAQIIDVLRRDNGATARIAGVPIDERRPEGIAEPFMKFAVSIGK